MAHKFTPLRLLAITLATTTALPVMASAVEADTSAANTAAQTDSAPIIVSASRATTSAHEIGSAVSVLTAEDLQRSQTVFVKDALQDIPGVITSSDRPGAYTSVSIRGSNNDEVLYLVDGIELGDPSFTSTEHRADHMIAADIASIEVLRGNQSSLYGSDAIGGVINITTKRATKDGVEANAEIEGGSHGTLNGGASLLAKTGALDLRLTATGYMHDGPSLADPATATVPVTERDEYWRYGFSGRAGLAATDNLKFQVTGFWLDSFSDLDGNGSDSDDTLKKREFAYAGQGEYTSTNGHFSAKGTASRYQARRLYFGVWNSDDGDMYKGTKDAVAMDLKYDPRGIFSLAVGGNMEWEKSDQFTDYSGDIHEGIDTKSGYAEIALRPLENLTLTGAARVDDNSRFGTFDTYRGTLAYVLGAAKLRASYGTGAKAPGLYQLFDPTYGNPNLDVETSRGWDVGVDLALSSKITAQASYFELSKKNEIMWDNDRGAFGGYSQWGRTKAHGVEFGIAANPTDWLRLSQAITYLEHTQDNDLDGVYVDSGRANYTASSSVTVLPTDKLELTVRGRIRDGDKSSSRHTKAYAVFDLLGSYQARENVQFYGRLVNLFDKQYQVAYGNNTLGFSGYFGVRVGF